MRTTTDPPLHTWRPSDPPAPSAPHGHDRQAIAERVNAHARRLDSGVLPSPPGRLIATGHQAWLWHPGILAKDMAMVEACRRFDASPLHLVVDQDAHEALTLTLPQQVGRRIETRSVRLASHRSDVPTGAQPPVDGQAVRRRLAELGDERVAPLAEAFADLPACRTLAEQLAVVTSRLMRPWLDGCPLSADGAHAKVGAAAMADAGEGADSGGCEGVTVPLLFVSDLPSVPGYGEVVERMVEDARRCVRAYNAAVRRQPGAGLTELVALRELVELPVWAVRWGSPRGRVFVDLADRRPWLVDEAGERIDREAVQLLPRALLLTAVMRSLGCDLFIHGKGGGLYDRVMEQWWGDWRGESLAPRAVVSADVHLPFEEVPVADRDELAKAVWFRHHVPHNVDRVLGMDGPDARRKLALLDQIVSMGRSRNRRHRKRRGEAYEQLHAVNAVLLDKHPELLETADQRLADARRGARNARLASRRDWCFALYPAQRLQALRSAFRSPLNEPA